MKNERNLQADRGEVLLREGVDAIAFVIDLAGIRPQKADDVLEQDRFAATGGAQYDCRLGTLEIDRNPAEDGVSSKRLVDVHEFHDRIERRLRFAHCAGCVIDIFQAVNCRGASASKRSKKSEGRGNWKT